MTCCDVVPPKLQVTLLVWPDGASSDTFMVLSGLASSLGRPVAAGRPGKDKTDEAWAKCRKKLLNKTEALPLLHLQLRDKLDKENWAVQ